MENKLGNKNISSGKLKNHNLSQRKLNSKKFSQGRKSLQSHKIIKKISTKNPKWSNRDPNWVQRGLKENLKKGFKILQLQ